MAQKPQKDESRIAPRVFRRSKLYASESGAGNSLSREDMRDRKNWLLYQSKLRCRAIRRHIYEESRVVDENSNWGLSRQALAAMVQKFAPVIASHEREKATTEAAQRIYRQRKGK